MDENLYTAIAQLQAQNAALTRATTALIVLCVVALLLLAGVVALLIWLRLRGQKVEAWLARELAALRQTPPCAEYAPRETTEPPPPSPPPAASNLRLRRQQQPAPRQPEPVNLMSTLNEMLASEQPYNFVEAARALDSMLDLQRLTPLAGSDAFAEETLLELGGDGLFASVQGDMAELYPNYSRFSATLDPKPLFDGARHGGRIHSILAPALLRRRDDSTWLLVQRGQVQMRQGS